MCRAFAVRNPARDVAAAWEIVCFIEFLKRKLSEDDAACHTAFVIARNHRAKLSALDEFPECRVQPELREPEPPAGGTANLRPPLPYFTFGKSRRTLRWHD